MKLFTRWDQHNNETPEPHQNILSTISQANLRAARTTHKTSCLLDRSAVSNHHNIGVMMILLLFILYPSKDIPQTHFEDLKFKTGTNPTISGRPNTQNILLHRSPMRNPTPEIMGKTMGVTSWPTPHECATMLNVTAKSSPVCHHLTL